MALILQNITYEQFLSYLIDDSKQEPFISKNDEIFKVKLDKNASQLILENTEGETFIKSADMMAFKKNDYDYLLAHDFKNVNETGYKSDKDSKHKPNSSVENDNAFLVDNSVSLMRNYVNQYTRTLNKRQLIANDRNELVGFILNQTLYIELSLAYHLAETWQVGFHLENSQSRKKHYKYWAHHLAEKYSIMSVPQDFVETLNFSEKDKESSYYKYTGDEKSMQVIPIALY